MGPPAFRRCKNQEQRCSHGRDRVDARRYNDDAPSDDDETDDDDVEVIGGSGGGGDDGDAGESPQGSPYDDGESVDFDGTDIDTVEANEEFQDLEGLVED